MANVLGNIIKKGKAGVELFIDGVKNTENKKCELTRYGYVGTDSFNTNFSENNGVAVVWNNKIHIMGGTSHYSTDGNTSKSESTLPVDFIQPSAVVYHGRIHILGGTYHYSYSGSYWSLVSRLPVNFRMGTAVVYNDEIHILGGYENKTIHYKFDGNSWSSVSTLPMSMQGLSSVVYNDEIHILGGNYTNNSTAHYRWNGSTWKYTSRLPFDFSSFTGKSAVVEDGRIHILGSTYTGGASNYPNSKYHYSWNGITWINEKDTGMTNSLYSHSNLLYNNKLFMVMRYGGGRAYEPVYFKELS